jgi:Ni/Fe-hydrogenase subunit HybB-like protein
MWKRPVDLDVLTEMSKITAGLISSWLLFRFADILFSGKLGLAFHWNIFSDLFWIEFLFLATAVFMLLDSSKRRDARLIFHGHLVAAIGGMLYRWDPTTLAFQPRPGAFYFPTPIELLVSVGFVSLAVAAFMFLAKVLPILPAPLRLWHCMEQEENASGRTPAGTQFVAAD